MAALTFRLPRQTFNSTGEQCLNRERSQLRVISFLCVVAGISLVDWLGVHVVEDSRTCWDRCFEVSVITTRVLS